MACPEEGKADVRGGEAPAVHGFEQVALTAAEKNAEYF